MILNSKMGAKMMLLSTPNLSVETFFQWVKSLAFDGLYFQWETLNAVAISATVPGNSFFPQIYLEC